MPRAITRDVSAAIGSCELVFLPRVAIDVDLAVKQHRQYRSALSSLGCNIVALPAESTLPDSVFVEDTALALDELAVMCLPGAKSRRAEVESVAEILRGHRPLAAIRPPGTLDGGDLLRVGNVIYAGLSTRSNPEGIEQLRSIVADVVIYPSSFPHTAEKLIQHGIDVIPVDVSELQKAEGAVTCCSLIVG